MELWLWGRLMFWEASCFICFRCLGHAVAGSRASWEQGGFLCPLVASALCCGRHLLLTATAEAVWAHKDKAGAPLIPALWTSLLLACRENSPEIFLLHILQCLTVCGPISRVARGRCCDSGQRRVITQHSKGPIHPECPLSLQHRLHSLQRKEFPCFPGLSHHAVLAAALPCLFQMPPFHLALTYTLD